MAVAHDAASIGRGTGTSFGLAHVVAGSDRVLYVAVIIDAAADFGPAVSSDLDGDFGAPIVEVTTGRYTAIFRRIAPSTGTHTLTVSSLPGGGEEQAIALSFGGVDQSTPNDTPVSEVNGDFSQDVASATDDLVVDWIGVNSGTGPTAGAGQTTPTDSSHTQPAMSSAASYEAGAATVTMSWSASGVYTHVALNLNASGGAETLSLPTIASTATLFPPTVRPVLALPTIASAATLFAPHVKPVLGLPTIASTATLTSPTVRLVLALPTIAAGTVVRAPTIAPSLALPTIGSTTTLFRPTVTQGTTLVLPTIAGGAVVRAPTVTLAVGLPTIAGASIVRTPSIAPRLALPTLASTTQLFAPGVALDLQVPAIASTASVRAPTVGLRLLLPHLASTVTLFAPSASDRTLPDNIIAATVTAGMPARSVTASLPARTVTFIG